ncbi:MAG: hypothetical protein IKK82_14080 [Kiritimatiellae bacterium]|nr:hypothetical protein [Kiritimatiellia bacterium]
MTKLQKMIAVLAGAAGFAVLDCFAVPVSGSDLNDGDTIFHLPFDGSMDSVSVKTFSSAGGGISYPSDGIAGVNVIDRSPVRVNGNCMKLDRSVAFVDVTDFGFDGQITSVTVEFHIKGESTGFPDAKHWPQLMGIVEGKESDLQLGTTATGEPFTFLVQINPTLNPTGVHCRLDSVNPVKSWPVNIPVFDGKWHRVVLQIGEMLSAESVVTGSVFKAYLDNAQLFHDSKPIEEFAWNGRTPSGDNRIFLKLGDKSSTFFIDEFRISKGALPESKLLKLRDDPVPENKETLMHLTFEGDVSSKVHSQDSPVLISGTPAFSQEVWNSRVGTVGAPPRSVRRQNGQSLKVDGLLQFKLPYWAMHRSALDSATIEFFIKGATEPLASTWSSPVRISESDVPFPLLLQIDDSHGYMLRMDGYEPIPGRTANSAFEQRAWHVGCSFHDGKWHHVAFTAVPLENGATEFCYYFDYEEVYRERTENLAWRGVDDGMFLEFGRNFNSTFWIDEMRITKGVLTPSEFLKAMPPSGTTVIFR